MGRQRQRGEPEQLLPTQGGLCSALRPGCRPGGALELPVRGRQRKQHRPHPGAEGRGRQAVGRGRERPTGGCTTMEGWKKFNRPFWFSVHGRKSAVGDGRWPSRGRRVYFIHLNIRLNICSKHRNTASQGCRLAALVLFFF